MHAGIPFMPYINESLKCYACWDPVYALHKWVLKVLRMLGSRSGLYINESLKCYTCWDPACRVETCSLLESTTHNKDSCAGRTVIFSCFSCLMLWVNKDRFKRKCYCTKQFLVTIMSLLNRAANISALRPSMKKCVEIQAAHSAALETGKVNWKCTAAQSITEPICATQTHYSENSGFDPVVVTVFARVISAPAYFEHPNF